MSGPCLIVSSGKRNGIILLLSSSINAHTYISLYLLGANVTSLNEFPIYSHCFSAFLVLNTVIKMQKNKFFLNFYTNGRNTNLSGKAGYGDNTFRGKQHVITYAGIGDRAYLNMQFVSEAPWSENNATRAGYGFHNAGANGGAIYLDIDGRLKFIASDTKTVYALDWHSL